MLYTAVPESSWRQLLFWLGIPGFFIAGLCLLTLDEPRNPGKGFLGEPLESSRFFRAAAGGLRSLAAAEELSSSIRKQAPPPPAEPAERQGFFEGLSALSTSRAFQVACLLRRAARRPLPAFFCHQKLRSVGVPSSGYEKDRVLPFLCSLQDSLLSLWGVCQQCRRAFFLFFFLRNMGSSGRPIWYKSC